MDGSVFDRLTQTLSASRSRRSVGRLLGGLALGGPVALRGVAESAAKSKKVTLCHAGQTIRVSRKARKKHLQHGDTRGACPVCIPQCAGRVCGPDGCGGECGVPCPGRRQICNAAGACVCPTGLTFCPQDGGRCDECCGNAECPAYSVCASDSGEPNHCVCVVPPACFGMCLSPGCAAGACGAQCSPSGAPCCPPLTCREEGGAGSGSFSCQP